VKMKHKKALLFICLCCVVGCPSSCLHILKIFVSGFHIKCKRLSIDDYFRLSEYSPLERRRKSWHRVHRPIRSPMPFYSARAY